MKRMIITAIITTCSVLNIMASDYNISGAWHGKLKITPQVELKIVFNFKTSEDNKPSVTLDSPDPFALMFQAEEMCMKAGRSVLMNCSIFTATEN